MLFSLVVPRSVEECQDKCLYRELCMPEVCLVAALYCCFFVSVWLWLLFKFCARTSVFYSPCPAGRNLVNLVNYCAARISVRVRGYFKSRRFLAGGRAWRRGGSRLMGANYSN